MSSLTGFGASQAAQSPFGSTAPSPFGAPQSVFGQQVSAADTACTSFKSPALHAVTTKLKLLLSAAAELITVWSIIQWRHIWSINLHVWRGTDSRLWRSKLGSLWLLEFWGMPS